MFKYILMSILLLGLMGCTSLRKEFLETPTPSSSEYSTPINNTVKAVTGDIQQPYNHVCRSQVLRQKFWLYNSNAVSSSAMLNNGIIVTAGHNYYSPWYNTVEALYIECGIGTAPNQAPLFKAENRNNKFQIFTNRKYSWDFQNDVSFVKICGSESFSNSSLFRLATEPELTLVKNGQSIYSAGYPADGPWKGAQQLTHFKTRVFDQDSDFSNNNNIANYTNTMTYKGMSGSAVWIKLGSELVIVGVHVTNGGAYIFTPELLKDYANWLKNMKSIGC